MEAIKISRFDEYTQNILKETYGQLNRSWDFDFDIGNLAHWPGFPRIITWLEFFNQYYYQSMLSYTKLIVSLIKVAQKNPLFCAQSKHEQEVSFSFFKSVFRSAGTLQLNDFQESEYLLTIALLFGRYPGMVRGSVKNSISSNTTIDILELRKLFENLFVKFERVSLLTNNLCLLELRELEFLMWINQGKSARHFENIPIPISKKESYLFCQTPELDWGFEDDILKRGIIITKFLKIENNANFLHPFLKGNQIFNYNLSAFWEDVEFWYRAYRILLKVDWEESTIGVREYVDYLVYKRTRSNETYKIKGRTKESLERAVQIWHGVSDFELDTKLLLMEWGKPQINEVYFRNKKYVFKEITNGNRLYQESETMNHCVFTYIQGCNTGAFKIWNLSCLGDCEMSLLTIQTRGIDIIQVQGKNNRNPNPLELLVINKWMGIMGYVDKTESEEFF